MFYLVVGVFGATVGVVFSALPEELVLATAGLALLGAIGTSLAVALTVESSNKQVEGKQVEGKQVKNQRDAALVTFLVTASGVTLLGIGSAFWGLLAGVLVTGLRRIGLS
ncbi:MAG: benzoate/H(+) symporter BenE family transporter [Phormidesmis sp.]